jgi:hypothetical protein
MAWDPATIMRALERGDAKEFSILLRAHPEFLRDPDGKDCWMWLAAHQGKLEIIKALVDLGMDVNERWAGADDDPTSPFYEPVGPILHAAGAGHLETVRWMLEHGAKINFPIKGIQTCLPLQYAATGGHLDVVRLLVENGAEFNYVSNGSNPITRAEDFGRFAIRDYLHSLGARTLRETTAPNYATAQKRFIKYLTQQRGPLADWRIKIPGDPLVTIRLIPANKKCKFQTLFTVGLSDHRLPQGQYEFACTELQCMLPRKWRLTDAALKDAEWNWPVEWLKRIIGELRLLDWWPKEPLVFMNGDPPAALAPGTTLSGWLCLRALSEGIQAPDYRWIIIHSLFPIYAEEKALVEQSGHEELVNRLQANNVPLHVDPKRKNVAMTSS